MLIFSYFEYVYLQKVSNKMCFLKIIVKNSIKNYCMKNGISSYHCKMKY